MLNQHPSTLRTFEDVPSYQGSPFYQRSPGMPLTNIQEGLDGIELSLYGDTLYYSPSTSDYFYSIETQYLRASPANDTLAAQRASNSVKNLGQRGGNANGFSGDSNGAIYMLMPEHNAITTTRLPSRSRISCAIPQSSGLIARTWVSIVTSISTSIYCHISLIGTTERT